MAPLPPSDDTRHDDNNADSTTTRHPPPTAPSPNISRPDLLTASSLLSRPRVLPSALLPPLDASAGPAAPAGTATSSSTAAPAPPSQMSPAASASASSSATSSSSSHSPPHSPFPPHPHNPAHPEPPQSRYVAHAPGPAEPMPEKCYTWCKQRADGPAVCHMLCLRKRAPVASQADSLARLRPPTFREAVAHATSSAAASSGQAPSTGTATVAAERQSSPSSSGANTTPTTTSTWAPFESLRARLLPYAIIFAKGTTDGVVGRYMEELEFDDGNCDFGPLSRHAPPELRRKSSGQFEWLDWEDAGYLIHLPLTSLFSPILNLPTNLHRVIDPPTRLVQKYIASFTDGTQARAWSRLSDDVARGGALDMAGQIGAFYKRKAREAAQAEAEAEAARNGEAPPGPGAARAAPRKEKEGGKGE